MPHYYSSEDPSSSSPSSLAAAMAMNATAGAAAAAQEAAAAAAKFNPSMAIIIVVLLGTFFFMGFLSVYVKKCVTTEGDMEHHHWANMDHTNGGWIFGSSGPMQQNHLHHHHHHHQLGLEKSIIQALPIVGFSKSKECCVCLSEFQDGDCLRLLPRCGHTFHVECIDMWLFSHSTCPLCRFKLTPENIGPESGGAASNEPAGNLSRPADNVAGPQPQELEIVIDGQDAPPGPDPTVVDQEYSGKIHGIFLKVWEFLLGRLKFT